MAKVASRQNNEQGNSYQMICHIRDYDAADRLIKIQHQAADGAVLDGESLVYGQRDRRTIKN